MKHNILKQIGHNEKSSTKQVQSTKCLYKEIRNSHTNTLKVYLKALGKRKGWGEGEKGGVERDREINRAV